MDGMKEINGRKEGRKNGMEMGRWDLTYKGQQVVIEGRLSITD